MRRDASPRDPSPRATLGATVPSGPVVLDTNVFINALAGRGPDVLRELLEALPRLFVAAPARAELAWVRGRLDPDHPGTARVVATYNALLSRVDPAKVLVPTGFRRANSRAVRLGLWRAAAAGLRRHSIVWS